MAPGESLISPISCSVPPRDTSRRSAFRCGADGCSPTATPSTLHASSSSTSGWRSVLARPGSRRDAGCSNPENPDELTKPGPKTAMVHRRRGGRQRRKMAGLVTNEDDRVGTYYFPMAQERGATLTLAVKTAGDPMSARRLCPAGAVEPRSRTAALQRAHACDDRIDETLTDRRTPMVLAVGFAGGRAVPGRDRPLRRARVSGRAATQRDRHPDGARQRAAGIFALVLREGLTVLAAGFAAGAAGAFAIRRDHGVAARTESERWTPRSRLSAASSRSSLWSRARAGQACVTHRSS